MGFCLLGASLLNLSLVSIGHILGCEAACLGLEAHSMLAMIELVEINLLASTIIR